MKAADKEACGQQQVARVVQGGADGLPCGHRLHARCGRLQRVALEQEGGRQRQQHQDPHDLHCIGPAHADHQRAGNRRHDELAERAARIDDAGGKAALFGWNEPGRGGHQHRRACHARATGGQHADGEDQAPGRRHERCDEGAQRDQHHTGEKHTPGAHLVGHGAGKRLREAPPQLAEGKGQADAPQAQACGCIERTQEQAHRLAGAHGQRKGTGRSQQHQPHGQAFLVVTHHRSLQQGKGVQGIHRSAHAERLRAHCPGSG